MSDYQEKYLKYKNKYRALQLQLGAGNEAALRKAGFTDLTIWGKAIKDIPKDEINKMIELKKNGFSDHSAIRCSKLNKENYDRIFVLKKNGFNDYFAICGSKLNKRIYDRMIELKKNGFSEAWAINGSTTENTVYDNMIKLKAVGVEGAYCQELAEAILSDDETWSINRTERINKIILLKQNGFKDYDLAKVSRLFSEKKIDHMLQVKKEKNLSDDDAVNEESKLKN
jgi:hypothetical protein